MRPLPAVEAERPMSDSTMTQTPRTSRASVAPSFVSASASTPRWSTADLGHGRSVSMSMAGSEWNQQESQFRSALGGSGGGGRDKALPPLPYPLPSPSPSLENFAESVLRHPLLSSPSISSYPFPSAHARMAFSSTTNLGSPSPSIISRQRHRKTHSRSTQRDWAGMYRARHELEKRWFGLGRYNPDLNQDLAELGREGERWEPGMRRLSGHGDS